MDNLLPLGIIVFSVIVMIASSGIRPWYAQRDFIRAMWLYAITAVGLLRIAFLVIRGLFTGSFAGLSATLTWFSWFLAIYLVGPWLLYLIIERPWRRQTRAPAATVAAVLPPPVDLHLPPTTADLCPRCSRRLKRRSGRFGPFMGCSGYPKCSFTRSLTPMRRKA
jgi:hypothetical protein